MLIVLAVVGGVAFARSGGDTQRSLRIEAASGDVRTVCAVVTNTGDDDPVESASATVLALGPQWIQADEAGDRAIVVPGAASVDSASDGPRRITLVAGNGSVVSVASRVDNGDLAEGAWAAALVELSASAGSTPVRITAGEGC